MAWLWFFAVVLQAALVLALIRRRFGPGRVHRRIASPLAVVERALDDALLELGGPAVDKVWVNPFEPCAERLCAISRAELLSLGREASEQHHRLVSVIRAWNASAGRAERTASLLPLLVAAQRAAHTLSLCLEEEALLRARSAASGRVLHGLVGPLGVDLWAS